MGNLTLLIARMQNNADTVEKDVLHAEELLLIVRKHSLIQCIFVIINIYIEYIDMLFLFAQDADNEKKNKTLIHQKENADLLGQAEGLLKDLFLDMDKAKKMKHPQAMEIENE